MAVVVRTSSAFDLAPLLALVELAFGGLGTLDTLETRASTLTGYVNAASIFTLIAVLDAS